MTTMTPIRMYFLRALLRRCWRSSSASRAWRFAFCRSRLSVPTEAAGYDDSTVARRSARPQVRSRLPCGTRGPDRPEVRRHLGGRRRPDPGRGRARRLHPAARATTWSSWSSAMGKETDNLIALANAVSTHAARPRDGHAAHHRRAQDHGAAVHGPRRPRRRRGVASPAARSASSPTTSTARPRSSRSRATGSASALADGQGLRGRRLPGRVDRRRRSPPSAGVASDTHRRRAGGGLRRRQLRDLHRRHRRVHAPIPASCRSARKLTRVSFDEMLEMAAAGGRVLALRSVEFARNHHVALHVRSSFTWEPGTWVTDEEPSMEDPIISAVTHDVVRGQGDGHARARPARHLGGAVRAAGRRRTSTST